MTLPAINTSSSLPRITPPKTNHQARFEQFHKKNFYIYRKLVELARLAKKVGFDRYSINSLFEQLRWHYLIEKKDLSFKLNNTYRSLYARRIMERERDLRGFFETRQLTAH